MGQNHGRSTGLLVAVGAGVNTDASVASFDHKGSTVRLVMRA